MQQEKGETSPSFSTKEEAGSSKQTAESTQEEKLIENVKHSTRKTRKFAYRSGYIPQSLTIGQERNQNLPTSFVKRYDPSLQINRLPGRVYKLPSTGEVLQEAIPKSHPSSAIPVIASSSRPYIQVPRPLHLQSSGLIRQSRLEQLDKDKQTTVQEKLSDSDVDEKLSDQNTFSPSSDTSSPFRLHGLYGDHNLTDPVKHNDPSPHTDHLPGSAIMFPDISVVPQYPLHGRAFPEDTTRSHPINASIPVFASSSRPDIQVPRALHLQSSDLIRQLRGEELLKALQMSKEKFSDSDVDKKMSDQNTFSPSSDTSSPFRLHGLYGDHNWTDPDLLHSSPTLSSPPQESIGKTLKGNSSKAVPFSLLKERRKNHPYIGHHGRLEKFEGCQDNPHAVSKHELIHTLSDIDKNIPQRQQSRSVPLYPTPLVQIKRKTRKERGQKSPALDVKHNDPSPHIDHLPGSANMFPGTNVVPQYPLSGRSFPEDTTRSHPINAIIPVVDSTSRPLIRIPSPVHDSTRPLYTAHSFGTGREELDKNRQTTIEEKFSGGAVDEKMSDHNALSSPSNISSLTRSHRGQNKNLTDPDLPHSSSTFSPPDKRIKLQSLDEIFPPQHLLMHLGTLTTSLFEECPTEPESIEFISGDTDGAHAQSQKRSDYNLQSISGAEYPSTSLEEEPRPAEHSLPADSEPLMGQQTSFFCSLSDLIHFTPSFLSEISVNSPSSRDGGFSSNFRSSDVTTVTKGNRAQAELSSVHSEAESGGDVDAVSCSVTNTLQTQIQSFPSGPSWTTGSLPRSHSSPSLSHMTSAERKTLTRAQSLPDLQLNSSCEWFTPDITADEEDETYRFQCTGPGLYQCSMTGLVFHMEREGDVVYRTVPWNRKLLSQHHKQPAGPLFDIKCEQQSVCQLHLPHCEIRSTGGAGYLLVAHLDGESIEFIGPHKITETHVIINITGFSAFGNVKDEDSPPDPVRAMVLVFYKPPADPDPTSFLNLLLLPRNVVLTAVLRYRKKLDVDEHYISIPPYCKLHPQQEYTLSTSPEDDFVLVDPPTAEFDSDHYNNYLSSFQVTLEKTMTHLRLFLRDTKSSHSVWERRVCLSSSGVQRSCGQSTLNLPPNQRLFEIRSSFNEGVSGPVLKSLLDKLLEKKVMTASEEESANEIRNRGDKARFVIDTVRRKGEAASSEMIEALCDLDPFFSEHLGLM